MLLLKEASAPTLSQADRVLLFVLWNRNRKGFCSTDCRAASLLYLLLGSSRDGLSGGSLTLDMFYQCSALWPSGPHSAAPSLSVWVTSRHREAMLNAKDDVIVAEPDRTGESESEQIWDYSHFL